jgi:hypothetical protein
MPGDPSGSAEQVINCFTGDTAVSFNSLKKSIKSFYTGEIITIKTKLGYHISVTPNHPIMTNEGLIAAKFVNEFTNLVCCPMDVSFSADLDVNNIPSTFKQVHDSLSVVGMGVGVAGVDVNLYGRETSGDVNVVGAAGFLWNAYQSFVCEFFNKFGLEKTNLRQSSLFGFCLLNGELGVEFTRLIPNRLISPFNLMNTLFLRHLRPFEGFGFRLGSDVDAILSQYPSHHISRYAEMLGDSIFTDPRLVKLNDSIIVNREFPRFDLISVLFKELINERFAAPEGFSDYWWKYSRFVHFDNPVKINRVFSHNAPVYTLETNEGVYNAGGIISGNCRCAQIYVLPD